MKKTLATLACLLAALLTTPLHAGELQTQLDQALQDKTIPAMAALLIRHGVVVEQAIGGVRASGSSEAARAGDVWNIGSDGKAMTATLIARLVERGVLSWQAPLSAMLPELADGMRPEYRSVTLVDLLAHRAGLPPNPDENWINSTYTDPRALPALRQAYARLALSEAPVGPPQQDFSYSNSGAVIAAAIAERATGKSFEELIQAEVFGPLAMTVQYVPTGPGQIQGHKDGKPVTGLEAGNPLVMAPDGEMIMSIEDWAKFALDQMAGEHGKGKLLQTSTYVFLHTPQGQTNAALGWGVMQFPPQSPQRVLTHLGSNGYWHALIALAPGREDGILIAANAGEGSGAQAQQSALAKAIMSSFTAPK
jgi:CubicO group peptidase (beta-lactamase class C family)